MVTITWGSAEIHAQLERYSVFGRERVVIAASCTTRLQVQLSITLCEFSCISDISIVLVSLNRRVKVTDLQLHTVELLQTIRCESQSWADTMDEDRNKPKETEEAKAQRLGLKKVSA
jgi:hypothetical protein